MKPRIMYIERKAEGLIGPARIGRVSFSKTGATVSCRGQEFRSLRGRGFKSNYFDVETGDRYWISGCRKDGLDRLYGERLPIEIAEDVWEGYWTSIREQPEYRTKAVAQEELPGLRRSVPWLARHPTRPVPC